MQFIKKVSLAVLSLILMLSVACFTVSAASPSVGIEVSPDSVKVGDSVTVTFVFNASENIYQVKMEGTYNSSVLKYVSADQSEPTVSGGHITAIIGGGQSNTFTFSIKFTAIAAGDCRLSVDYSELLGLKGEIGYPKAEKTINIKNPSGNSNANLSSITISQGNLTPNFSPNITSYNVNLSEDVSQLIISAATADKNAKWTVSGSNDLDVGNNSRVITVTAQNGAAKEYTINIIRGSSTNASKNDDISVDGMAYKLTNDLSGVNIPNGFEEETYIINGKEVPAFKNKAANMVLVCLENDSLGKKLFVYDQESNTFSSLCTLSFQDRTYIVVRNYTSQEIPNDYIKATPNIQGVSVEAWHIENSDVSDFYLVYLINQEGSLGLYQYDSVESTFQRYVVSSGDGSQLTALSQENLRLASSLKTTKIVCVIFIGISFLALVLLVVSVIVFNKKYPIKNKHK